MIARKGLLWPVEETKCFSLIKQNQTLGLERCNYLTFVAKMLAENTHIAYWSGWLKISDMIMASRLQVFLHDVPCIQNICYSPLEFWYHGGSKWKNLVPTILQTCVQKWHLELLMIISHNDVILTGPLFDPCEGKWLHVWTELSRLDRQVRT